ncbi:MAG: hypothetical protein H6981_08630 [Gammaproteobacteria bacterium]|nr:hypothetical protein [Gammaproteobacteria bacterium]MCP5136853.1 hypothetical protein [Gammaproteobacteria bacterium]
MSGRRRRMRLGVFAGLLSGVLFGLSLGAVPVANATPVPRAVLAFYDADQDPEIAHLRIHQIAEMPLNHLGLTVRYQDLGAPLPEADEMADVRGVMLWLEQSHVPNATALLNWLIAQMEAGRKVLIMGPHAFLYDALSGPVEPSLAARFWKTLGLAVGDLWVADTFDSKFAYDPRLVGFERPIEGVLPPYQEMHAIDPAMKIHLRARVGQDENTDPRVLIASGPHGGYVAEGYVLEFDVDKAMRRYFLNPFEFFRQVFATDDLPKADVTTLAGRRLYFSHIDGDGWRNRALIPEYKQHNGLATEVLLDKVFRAYPDLPVTIGPIVADIDPAYFGTPEFDQLAKDIFYLPNVEAASHTYSHPLQWRFFQHPTPGMERAFLDRYPRPRKEDDGKLKSVWDLFRKSEKNPAPAPDSAYAVQEAGTEQDLSKGYAVPRAYYTGPYDNEKEIGGSLEKMADYLLPGDRAEVLLWSGNTQPYAAAIRLTRQLKVRNLNGGDTRFDRKFQSYAWVAAIGREARDAQGSERQIYAASSNENTYTNLWTGPYYGFRNLRQTLKNTGRPLRVKPLNIYYHMYTGERLASLRALLDNIDYVRTLEITPITASQYAAVADGFYTTRFEALGADRWRVHDRGDLQTLRFDRATFRAVDFTRSRGVIGQNHQQGSLYVYLDAAEPAPEVALRDIERSDVDPPADRVYLIDARWPVHAMKRNGDGFGATLQGFGPGEMHWWVPHSGRYRMRAENVRGLTSQAEVQVGDDHRLILSLDEAPIYQTTITVERVPGE